MEHEAYFVYKHVLFLLLMFGLSNSGITLAEPDAVQSHEAIYAVAKQFVEQRFSDSQAEQETSFLPLDPRLQLAACSVPLEVFINTPALKPGRNAIGIKCNGPKSWSLYVSALIKIFQDVVVLTRPVQRGDILSAAQLTVNHMDVSPLRAAFIHDVDAAIFKQAVHNLTQGAILYERDISAAILVKRGENVTISSANPNLSIEMQGLALMDGAQGQRIKVKNTTSNRVISAVVTKAGMVSVDF